MTKNAIIAFVVIALVVGFGIGYLAVRSGSLGATVNYSNNGGSLNLYTELASIVQDLQATRSPLSTLATGATGSLAFPTATSSEATTTQVSGLPAAAGDLVLVSAVTPTSTAVYSASVDLASTTSATFTILMTPSPVTAGAAVSPTASVFNLTVLPAATFKVPAALVTVTSTSN